MMEILMGMFLFFYGGVLVTGALPLGIIFMVLTVFFGRSLIEQLKKRYIYPRAGYVKLQPDPKTTGKGIGLAAALMVAVLLGAMAIAIALLGLEPGRDFFLKFIVPPASGFMLAIGPFWLGQTYGLMRGYLWAVLFAAGGITMPVFNLASGYVAVGHLCTWIGLLILITGTLMFVNFLRNHPAEPLETKGASNAG
jgi:hypothetical protein